MLVSPTTLLVALRTISNLWRYEHQSQNAKRIADRAARLYDKLRLFVDDMQSMGQSLDKAQVSYRSAMNKLTLGRGNLIGQVEGFRALGVEIKRPINPSLAEQAMAEDSGDSHGIEDDSPELARAELDNLAALDHASQHSGEYDASAVINDDESDFAAGEPAGKPGHF